MRVVIAEDLALLRDGLERLLRDSGFDVVAAVADGPALLDAVEGTSPDVAIVDVRLPPAFRDEGVRAALELRRRRPGFPVLILSQYVEQTYAAELLADGTGGVGYLLKDRVSDVREFVEAVRRVASGGMALDPEAVSQLVAGHEDGPLAQLTHARARRAGADGRRAAPTTGSPTSWRSRPAASRSTSPASSPSSACRRPTRRTGACWPWSPG